MLIFITSLCSANNKEQQNKALLFWKSNSLWETICLSINETGEPHQLSRCHLFWQLQDTLFTSAVECDTEGHLSFLWKEKSWQKIFLLLQNMIYLGTSQRCEREAAEQTGHMGSV